MTDRVERVINAIADEIQSHCLDAWSSATETALARAAIAAMDAEPLEDVSLEDALRGHRFIVTHVAFVRDEYLAEVMDWRDVKRHKATGPTIDEAIRSAVAAAKGGA